MKRIERFNWGHKENNLKVIFLFILFISVLAACQNKNKNTEDNIDLKVNQQVGEPIKDDESNIKEDKNVIEKSLANIHYFEYKKYRHENSDYVESVELANFLNIKLPFFREKGGGIIEDSNFATHEIVLCESKTDNEVSNKRVRYVFIDEKVGDKRLVRDTLRIVKGLDFSEVLLSVDKKKIGICTGTYSISEQDDEYFEINAIYSINNEGKLVKESLKTVIYDCPAPSDYVRDEEPNSYRFGIKGGKKLERFWYEN